MFEQFWALCIRKVAKKDAEKAFNQLKSDERLKAIEAMPKHVEYWKATNTEMTFIPYPASWLRGARFDDEIELPVAKQPTQAWWTTEQGMLAKGRELNTEPRPGEDWNGFRTRLTGMMRG
jgi:hypothetical protein